MLEVPHLGRLMDKIRGPLAAEERRLTYQAPELPAPPKAQATPNSNPTN
jgi:hypothetical protein